MSPKKAKLDAEARRIKQARRVAAQADHITELLDRLDAVKAHKDVAVRRLKEQLRAEQQAAGTRISALKSRVSALEKELAEIHYGLGSSTLHKNDACARIERTLLAIPKVKND